MAGIPLTSGFIGKWAVFEVALVGGRLAGGDRGGARQRRGGVLLRPGHRADVLPRARVRAARTSCTAVAADLGHHRVGAAATLLLGVVPGPGARPGAGMRDNSSGEPTDAAPAAGLALPVTDEALAARLARPDGTRSRRRWPATSAAGAPFVTEAASHLMEAGGKRFRPLLVLLAAETGRHPDVRRGDHRRLRRRAHPPRPRSTTTT